jgi:hypothetical protein
VFYFYYFKSFIKTISEVYILIKENMKPTPMKPQYLFNFKDVGRVIQGMLLLASKSKVVPVKVAKKCKQIFSILYF